MRQGGPTEEGPRTKPLIPTMIISVIARMRSAWSSNSLKTSELVMGAMAAAVRPSAARRAISSGQQRAVDHLHEQREAESEERDRGRPEGGVRTR